MGTYSHLTANLVSGPLGLYRTNFLFTCQVGYEMLVCIITDVIHHRQQKRPPPWASSSRWWPRRTTVPGFSPYIRLFI